MRLRPLSSGRSVALLAEGVDRNSNSFALYTLAQLVALLAEGVDRNTFFELFGWNTRTSPSSRRAWIEIICSGGVVTGLHIVALLAEGVDRNC